MKLSRWRRRKQKCRKPERYERTQLPQEGRVGPGSGMALGETTWRDEDLGSHVLS